jgi:uncharacterized protein YecE (DUF72 family)
VIENLKLGMQGWKHEEWVGRTYPTNIPRSRWLCQYSTRFPTVEVDETFYGVPPEPLVRLWRDSVESDFSFSLKVPQQITHEQRFAVGGGLLNRFLDRVSFLEEKLGPVLLISPPGFLPDDDNKATLRRFIDHLPSDFGWALELKNDGWHTDAIHDMLSNRNVALVTGTSRWISLPVMLRMAEKPSADFAYIRWNIPSYPRTKPGEKVDARANTAVWEETLARLCGLVDSVYGYFHSRAFGNGLRSAKDLQYSIDQSRPGASV